MVVQVPGDPVTVGEHPQFAVPLTLGEMQGERGVFGEQRQAGRSSSSNGADPGVRVTTNTPNVD